MQTMTKIIVAVALLVGLAGCHHMTYTTIPGELVADGRLQVRDVGAFEVEVTEHYFLFGLAKTSDEKVARAIVEKVREMGGNGVKDLKYKVNYGFLNMCGNLLSAYLLSWNTQTVIVSGTVVQITGANADRAIPMQQLQAVADGNGKLEIPVSYQ